jgi:DNA-binding MurR/RpiR family transcriptional regulator
MYVEAMNSPSFSRQLASSNSALTPAERKVIAYLGQHREAALVASAAEMARRIGTSDATIIRTARKLGFAGLEQMRQALAGDLRRDLSLSERVDNVLSRAGDGPGGALAQTLETLRATLEALEQTPEADLEQAVAALTGARRVHVFGIGPSGHLAGYFAAQLTRLGGDARELRNTGLQFADDLIGIGPGDAVLALAYDRPYREVTALFDHATALSLPAILVTSPGPVLPDFRARVVLRVARGRSDGFGLHAGTMALLEALLVACAARDPEGMHASLARFNRARRSLSGDGMGLRVDDPAE